MSAPSSPPTPPPAAAPAAPDNPVVAIFARAERVFEARVETILNAKRAKARAANAPFNARKAKRDARTVAGREKLDALVRRLADLAFAQHAALPPSVADAVAAALQGAAAAVVAGAVLAAATAPPPAPPVAPPVQAEGAGAPLRAARPVQLDAEADQDVSKDLLDTSSCSDDCASLNGALCSVAAHHSSAAAPDRHIFPATESVVNFVLQCDDADDHGHATRVASQHRSNISMSNPAVRDNGADASVGHGATAADRSPTDSSDLDRLGRDSSDRDNLGRDMSGRDRLVRDTSGRDRLVKDASGRDMSVRDASANDRSGRGYSPPIVHRGVNIDTTADMDRAVMDRAGERSLHMCAPSRHEWMSPEAAVMTSPTVPEPLLADLHSAQQQQQMHMNGTSLQIGTPDMDLDGGFHLAHVALHGSMAHQEHHMQQSHHMEHHVDHHIEAQQQQNQHQQQAATVLNSGLHTTIHAPLPHMSSMLHSHSHMLDAAHDAHYLSHHNTHLPLHTPLHHNKLLRHPCTSIDQL